MIFGICSATAFNTFSIFLPFSLIMSLIEPIPAFCNPSLTFEINSATPLEIAVFAFEIAVCIPPVALLACSAKLAYCPVPSLFNFTICCIKSSIEILPFCIAL